MVLQKCQAGETISSAVLDSPWVSCVSMSFASQSEEYPTVQLGDYVFFNGILNGTSPLHSYSLQYVQDQLGCELD